MLDYWQFQNKTSIVPQMNRPCLQGVSGGESSIKQCLRMAWKRFETAPFSASTSIRRGNAEQWKHTVLPIWLMFLQDALTKGPVIRNRGDLFHVKHRK